MCVATQLQKNFKLYIIELLNNSTNTWSKQVAQLRLKPAGSIAYYEITKSWGAYKEDLRRGSKSWICSGAPELMKAETCFVSCPAFCANAGSWKWSPKFLEKIVARERLMTLSLILSMIEWSRPVCQLHLRCRIEIWVLCSTKITISLHFLTNNLICDMSS